MSLLYRMGTGNGSGGDLKPFIINFTCDSGFIGKTVTMEFQGTPHAGEIVENVSGTVVLDSTDGKGKLTLYPMHDGLWKYYATSDVSGYHEVTITLEKWGNYPVELNDIPKGATVTPTDDIQTWLKCAELNKSYTTISEVLADTNTLLALISDNNASDYLARSTTWVSDVCNNESAMTYIGLDDYCAWSLLDNDTWNEAICYSPYFEKVLNVHLDTLDSSSTEVTAESYFAQYDYFPYNAFDGNESTGWWAYSKTLKDSFWLQYKSNKLANVIMKKAILIGTTGSTLLPPQDIVLYRNDDIPLCDAFKITDKSGDTKTTIIVFNNNKVGKSDTYKLITTCTPNGNSSGGYNGAIIFELQFYGRERA